MGNIKKAVLKATDGKLKSDNWQYILDVCDLVSEDPEDGGKEAIEVVESRLSQRDANVILRTLSLITSLAENCGSRLQQLIASKDFTSKLYSLVESKHVHGTVKMEVVKVVEQLSSSFKKDPSLKYMKDLYVKISKNHSQLLQDAQPNVPDKHEMSYQSKLREDRDLEEALRLSLLSHQEQEKQKQLKVEQAAASTTMSDVNASVPSTSKLQQDNTLQQRLLQQQRSNSPPNLASTSPPKRVRALYDLASNDPDELNFKKGDVIVVLEQVYRDWWRGSLRGSIGIFPLNYVTPVAELTQQEIKREQAKEQQLLVQKNKVDQLYFKLVDAGSRAEDPTQDPQINELYGSVTPLRPEVAKSIGKYARKREDLLSLRQVLANAETTYNQLLDRATNAYTAPVPLHPPPRSTQRPSPNHIPPYPQ